VILAEVREEASYVRHNRHKIAFLFSAMRHFADGGIMASKSCAASGKYIQKQVNHCKACCYDPKRVTGEHAYPYNSLYWNFIDRHKAVLSQNPRMGLILGGWRKRSDEDREAVLHWADLTLEQIAEL